MTSPTSIDELQTCMDNLTQGKVSWYLIVRISSDDLIAPVLSNLNVLVMLPISQKAGEAIQKIIK